MKTFIWADSFISPAIGCWPSLRSSTFSLCFSLFIQDPPLLLKTAQWSSIYLESTSLICDAFLSSHQREPFFEPAFDWLFCILESNLDFNAISMTFSFYNFSVCYIVSLFYFWHHVLLCWSFQGGSNGKKKSTCQCRRCRFNPWVGKIPWRRKWRSTPVFLLG